MKFCPSCGAALAGGVASFCPECGKQIPQTSSPLKKEASNARRKPSKKKRLKVKVKKKSDNSNTPAILNDGYDGYYEDTPTSDSRREKEPMDPALIKRILIVSVGAAVIILLVAALMILL